MTQKKNTKQIIGKSSKQNWLKASLTTSLGITLLSVIATQSIQAQEITTSSSKETNVTIYNQNFGLVKDVREVELKSGINQVRFEDIASQIDPTTVSFQSLTAPNSVTVKEQNYQYDLIDPNTVLSKSIGKHVIFKQFSPNGQVQELSGTLLNAPQDLSSHGLVVKTNNGIVLNPEGQVELAELPPGLISKPSLLWRIDALKEGLHKTEIAYQTNGLNWHCDYVVIINRDDTQADVTSWVTLDNRCGTSFKNAGLKLIAGDVHKVIPHVQHYAAHAMAASSSIDNSQFQENSFAEYHLYNLKGKVNLNNNETKQMTLFSASNIATKKLFVYEPEAASYVWGNWIPPSRDADKINVKLEIENKQSNHLGMPMPKGKVRVYKSDSDNALQFIGEDMIDHTPRDEKMRIYIGNAFDLVGEHKQINVERISNKTQRRNIEIDLRNHKDEDVTICAVEHAYGDWKIIQSSQTYTKKDSKTFEFQVKVPANSESKVTYLIETQQ